ncbi:hypothetical protein SDJN03_16599, partial [Cucurbita argyrosperma subsp. sororia]
MASYLYLWRKYAGYVYTKWERTILWDMIDPYRPPKSFAPLVTVQYILALPSPSNSTRKESMFLAIWESGKRAMWFNGEVLGRSPWVSSTFNETKVLEVKAQALAILLLVHTGNMVC